MHARYFGISIGTSFTRPALFSHAARQLTASSLLQSREAPSPKGIDNMADLPLPGSPEIKSLHFLWHMNAVSGEALTGARPSGPGLITVPWVVHGDAFGGECVGGSDG